jgi:anaerobic magnesium-protoporphyrin IX monomethyl ester cyclase
MRVILVNPGKFKFPYPPLCLTYLASYIRKFGENRHQTVIADENTGQNVIKMIIENQPDVIGITATTPQITRAHEIATIIKKRMPATPIVLGGAHVTLEPTRTLSWGNNFDAAVLGEGEKTFLELLEHLEGGGGADSLDSVEGVAYRVGEKIVCTPERPFLDDIDLVPYPARDLLNMDFYLRPTVMVRGFIEKGTVMITSRGCPYNCVFCASPKLCRRRIRFHSARYVAGEMEKIVEKYQPKVIFFMDDLFIADKPRIKALCRLLLKIPERPEWVAEARANLIREEDLDLLEMMREAGCVQLEFGFESGSERVLSFLKDSATVAQNQEAINVTKKAGLRIFGNFMLGTPYETREEMLQTQRFILNNFDKIDYYNVYHTSPYPGTQLWEMFKLDSSLKTENPWEDFTLTVAYKTNFLLRKDNPFNKNVDREAADEVESYLNYIAGQKVDLRYKISWSSIKMHQAPLLTVKQLIKYLKQSVAADSQ